MHLIQVTIYTVDDRMTRSAADCRWHSSLFTYSKEGGGRAAISCSSPSCPFSPFALALALTLMSKDLIEINSYSIKVILSLYQFFSNIRNITKYKYDVKMSKVRNSSTYDFDNNVQIKIQLWV